MVIVIPSLDSLKANPDSYQVCIMHEHMKPTFMKPTTTAPKLTILVIARHSVLPRTEHRAHRDVRVLPEKLAIHLLEILALLRCIS